MSEQDLLSKIIRGDDDKDRKTIEHLLDELFRWQALRPQLFKGLSHRVHKKNANDEARYQKLLKYEGPEPATIRLLEANAKMWSERPSSFRCLPKMSRIVKRMACIALAEWRQTDKVYPGDNMVKLLISQSGIVKDEHEAVKMFNNMLDKGHRYKNLEQRVGAGIAFVLGAKIAETQWTKILLKKDKRFEAVVHQLRSSPVFLLAQQYETLRNDVVTWYLTPEIDVHHQQGASLGSNALIEDPSHRDQLNTHTGSGGSPPAFDMGEFVDFTGCRSDDGDHSSCA